jgi:hypothetical protein
VPWRWRCALGSTGGPLLPVVTRCSTNAVQYITKDRALNITIQTHPRSHEVICLDYRSEIRHDSAEQRDAPVAGGRRLWRRRGESVAAAQQARRPGAEHTQHRRGRGTTSPVIALRGCGGCVRLRRRRAVCRGPAFLHNPPALARYAMGARVSKITAEEEARIGRKCAARRTAYQVRPRARAPGAPGWPSAGASCGSSRTRGRPAHPGRAPPCPATPGGPHTPGLHVRQPDRPAPLREARGGARDVLCLR